MEQKASRNCPWSEKQASVRVVELFLTPYLLLHMTEVLGYFRN